MSEELCYHWSVLDGVQATLTAITGWVSAGGRSLTKGTKKTHADGVYLSPTSRTVEALVHIMDVIKYGAMFTCYSPPFLS